MNLSVSANKWRMWSRLFFLPTDCTDEHRFLFGCAFLPTKDTEKHEVFLEFEDEESALWVSGFF